MGNAPLAPAGAQAHEITTAEYLVPGKCYQLVGTKFDNKYIENQEYFGSFIGSEQVPEGKKLNFSLGSKGMLDSEILYFRPTNI